MLKNGSMAFTHRIFWSNKARSRRKRWLMADGFVRGLVKRSLQGPPPDLTSSPALITLGSRIFLFNIVWDVYTWLHPMISRHPSLLNCAWLSPCLFTTATKEHIVAIYTPPPLTNTNTHACVHMHICTQPPLLHRQLLWDQLPE